MKTQFDLKMVLKTGAIQNEPEYERALIADRKLRVLAKSNPKLQLVRKKLRTLIQDYENKNWSGEVTINKKKLEESDIAESIAEKERLFIERRKNLIRSKLKRLGLNQQELGTILGHNSKSYMSELMNGLYPFPLKDLVIINKLLEIDLIDLVPTFLSYPEQLKIRCSIEKLNNPKLNKEIFAYA